MKGIAANLILLLLPIIIFIIVYYLTGLALSREIRILDISSKVSKMINEFEAYKNSISKKVKEVKDAFTIDTYYLSIKVTNVKVEGNRINYEIYAMPKEKIEGINFLIFYYGSEELS